MSSVSELTPFSPLLYFDMIQSTFYLEKWTDKGIRNNHVLTILYYLSTLMSSLHSCPPLLSYSLFAVIQLNLQQLVACVDESNREVEGILKKNKP